ncbi:MAG TPA: hypothetical protein VNX01_07820 [Bacteroidia bacterium]|jgi:hypothetical protein|nr:hypothetical protein [Bacteroidia bacterium]
MKLYFKLYTYCLLILISNTLFAQKGYDQAKEVTYNANIANTDSSVRAEVYYETNKNIKIEQNVVYYWFYLNKILSTQGGFEGRLLHGTYSCFYPNNNLKEKGEFKDGQKTGKWIAWYTNGKIRETSTWKKSVKNGLNEFFDKDGNVTLQANYKYGKLDGSYAEYKDGKQLKQKKYKDGKELVTVPKSDSTSFGNKIKNLFKPKKKEKVNSADNPKENKNNSSTQKPKEEKKKAKKEKEVKTENKEPVKETSKEKKKEKDSTKKKSKKDKEAAETPETKK